MLNPISCTELSAPSNIPIYHTGPALDNGPYPSFFYFALSGTDSLCLDPYNQPVTFSSKSPVRIFSMTLPGHEANLPPKGALQIWADDFGKNHDFLSTFIDQVLMNIEYLIEQKLIDPNHLGIAGLSRGGYIAAKIAACDQRIKYLLLFAPVTRLELLVEFKQMHTHPLVKKHSLSLCAESLCEKRVQIFMGNRDVRVGTHACFSFYEELVETAFAKRIRTPQLNLNLSPSIGKDGHGTGPQIFKQGAQWITQCLLNP